MKFLLVLSLSVIALSFSNNSQAQDDQSKISPTPVFGVYCDKHDYPLLNRIENVQKLRETPDEVTFTFESSVVSCKDQVVSVVPVDPSLVHVGIVKDGFGGIFGQGFIKESHIANSEVTKIELTFNKTKAFKDQRTQRKLDLYYYPWGAGPYSRYFSWYVTLSKDISGTANLSLQIH